MCGLFLTPPCDRDPTTNLVTALALPAEDFYSVVPGVPLEPPVSFSCYLKAALDITTTHPPSNLNESFSQLSFR